MSLIKLYMLFVWTHTLFASRG